MNLGKKHLIGLLGVILLFRLWGAVFAMQHIISFMEVDSQAYVGLAQNLLQTGKYVHPIDPDEDLYRPPVYPLFLAGVMALSGGSVNAVPLLQALLCLLAAFLLYRCGVEVHSPRSGVAAALFYLLNPNSAFWSYKILTETLAGFWLVLAVYLLVRYWRTGLLRWALFSGLVLGLGALTRPILFPLAIAWIFILGWLALRKAPVNAPPRQGWKSTLLLALGFLVIVTPWQVRNYLTYQKYTISTVGTHALLDWNAARILEQAEGYSFIEAQKLLSQSGDPVNYSLQLVRRYPLITVKLQAKGIVRTLLGAEFDTWSRTFTNRSAPQSGILTILFGGGDAGQLWHSLQTLLGSPWFWAGMAALVYDGVLYLACLAGIYRSWKDQRGQDAWRLALVLLVSVSYLVLAPLATGDSRFRVPADPLLALLAGLAWLPRQKSAFIK